MRQLVWFSLGVGLLVGAWAACGPNETGLPDANVTERTQEEPQVTKEAGTQEAPQQEPNLCNEASCKDASTADDSLDEAVPEAPKETKEEAPPEEQAEPSPETAEPSEVPPETVASSSCTQEVFTWDGAKRLYILCVPKPLPSGAMPVVFGFHGGGGSAANWYKTMPLYQVGAKEGFVMVYMQGCRDGQSDCSVAGKYLWNVGKKDSLSSVDDQGYVKEVLQRLTTVHKLSIDPKRRFATGHSLGGIFSYSMWCDQPTLFAAIGPLSAPPSDATCKTQSNTSIFHVHGLKDANVPFAGGCCSLAQKTKASRSYLAGCDALPQCFNPTNWWPPVRSGQHPYTQLVGLDEMATQGLGCSTTFEETYNQGAVRCYAYKSCKNNKSAEACLLIGVDHSLNNMNAVLNLSNWLWSKFKTAQ